LTAALASKSLSTAQETWTIWTVGRLAPEDRSVDEWFANTGHTLSANARIQSIRIAGHRIRQYQPTATLPAFVVDALKDNEPRVRFAAVQAIEQARQSSLVGALADLAESESDRITFYATWQAIRNLSTTEQLQKLLQDNRGGVRRAALLALLEDDKLPKDSVNALVNDADTGVSGLAAQWMARLSGNPMVIMNPAPGEFSGELTINLLAGIKPAALRWTQDGSEPTPPGKGERAREGAKVTVNGTTTLKVALFKTTSDKKEKTYQQVGSTVTATWTQVAAAAELAPVELVPQEKPLTAQDVLPLVEDGDPILGQRILNAASCLTCHKVGREGKTFGPDLTAMGDKADAAHLIQSMLEPSAIIAEGFALLAVSTSDGNAYAGIFKEETNRALTLVQLDSSTVSIDKSLITSRDSMHHSVMPPYGNAMSAQQMADLIAFLLEQRSQASQ
jgi:putative heme-binding domain-containing protein